ncbi:MAG: serine acetyltransferase [Polyangiaceae bacterium]|nr:serine acetyltransferase [Polyangiaceae bacterium]
MVERLFSRFGKDVERYYELDSRDGHPTMREKAGIWVRSPQLQAVAVFRFGVWVNANVHRWLLRFPLRVLYRFLNLLTFALWGVHIDDGADIGGGLYIGHPGGVLIGPVKMGSNCNVGNNVTIGRRSDGRGSGGTPTIGDSVWIGTGSVIFGGITVGDGVSIAPLTVVGRNIPPQALVAGNPMKVLRERYDNTIQIHGARVQATLVLSDTPKVNAPSSTTSTSNDNDEASFPS